MEQKDSDAAISKAYSSYIQELRCNFGQAWRMANTDVGGSEVPYIATPAMQNFQLAAGCQEVVGVFMSDKPWVPGDDQLDSDSYEERSLDGKKIFVARVECDPGAKTVLVPAEAVHQLQEGNPEFLGQLAATVAPYLACQH